MMPPQMADSVLRNGIPKTGHLSHGRIGCLWACRVCGVGDSLLGDRVARGSECGIRAKHKETAQKCTSHERIKILNHVYVSFGIARYSVRRKIVSSTRVGVCGFFG
jgi:hypothetical protein